MNGFLFIILEAKDNPISKRFKTVPEFRSRGRVRVARDGHGGTGISPKNREKIKVNGIRRGESSFAPANPEIFIIHHSKFIIPKNNVFSLRDNYQTLKITKQ